MHGAKKRHMCEECGSAFEKKSGLTTHKATVHQRIRRFKCEQCNFTCYQGHGLKRHIKGVHEKIKDAICEVCGFMAARNDGLRQHREFCPTNDGSKKRKRQEVSKSDDNME